MAAPRNQIDPGHDSVRSMLRGAGPLLLLVGIVLLVLGAVQMFSPAWQDSPDPSAGFMEGRKSFDDVSRDMNRQFHDSTRSSFGGFAMVAAGMVLAAAGGAMTRFGYMGAVVRYAAEELAPVGADTVNYLGKNAQEGVREVAEAISEGVRGEGGGAEVRAARCPACHALNELGAKFCSQCGKAMAEA